MKITKEWLEVEHACEEGIAYYNTINETDALKIMERLLADKKLDFANWTICHLLKRENKVKYAIFAARQVLPLWGKKYPKEAAIWKAWADNPTADSAAWAAWAVWAVSSASTASADSAAWAARAAWAASTASAASTAMVARVASVASAASAASAASTAIELKIIRYGLELFKEEGV